MANYPRSLIIHDGAVFHVCWQSHNKSFLLGSDSAKKMYYDLLLKYHKLYRITVFSYCLMDNHIHMTGQCETQKNLSDFFRTVNSCFAKKINRVLNRKGQAVMDRFKSPVMETDNDLMNVMIYNDLNPLRTILKIHPKMFKWSSYHHYAYGKNDPLLTAPECYKEMGKTDVERQKKYRSMLQKIINEDNGVCDCPYRDHKGSILCFVGNPVWVKMRFDAMLAVVRQKKLEWRDRRREFLEQSAMR